MLRGQRQPTFCFSARLPATEWASAAAAAAAAPLAAIWARVVFCFLLLAAALPPFLRLPLPLPVVQNKWWAAGEGGVQLGCAQILLHIRASVPCLARLALGLACSSNTHGHTRSRACQHKLCTTGNAVLLTSPLRLWTTCAPQEPVKHNHKRTYTACT